VGIYSLNLECGIYGIALAVGLIAALTHHAFLKEALKEAKPITLGELKFAFKDPLHEIFESWRLMPKSLAFLIASTLVIASTDPFFHRFGSLYALNVVSLSSVEWGHREFGNAFCFGTVFGQGCRRFR
jgi:hypothetical protein